MVANTINTSNTSTKQKFRPVKLEQKMEIEWRYKITIWEEQDSINKAFGDKELKRYFRRLNSNLL